MSASHVVPASKGKELRVVRTPESRAERVRRMQAGARALAREQIEAMIGAMLELSSVAEEVADGGEAYPVGVRELSRRLGHELEVHAKTIEVLLARS
jgi:hypothetical protein